MMSIAIALVLSQRPSGATGSIAGVVVRSGSSTPIEDVRVTLERQGSSSAEIPFNDSTMTDDAGRFGFKNLPAGRYHVHWQRDGYFPHSRDVDGFQIYTSRSPLNVRNWNEEGWQAANSSIQVDIDASQAAKTLTLHLIPGGVISGRVLDSKGQPLAGGRITALRLSFEEGYPVLVGGRSVTANDRGDFRLWGLLPGRYHVRAEYRSTSGSPATIQFTYFPGVTQASAAQILEVRSTVESTGANFSIQPGTARILGSLNITPPSLAGPRRRSSNGSPLPYFTRFFLVPLDARNAVDLESVLITQGFTRNASEAFEVVGVRPGNYMLYAELNEPIESDDNKHYVGRAQVSIGTEDIDNVTIVIAAPNEIRGRMMSVDGGPLAWGKPSLQWRLRSGVYPVHPSLRSWETPGPDGTFKVEGIPGARYDLLVKDLPSHLAVVDIRQGGVSVFDEGIAADASQSVEVLVTDAVGTIEATVADAKGRPIADAVVALVPSAEHRINPNLYRRAEFDAARSQYRLEGIAPGDYTLFAWDSIPDAAEFNELFLKGFEDRGIRVTVQPRTSAIVQLPLLATENF
jgi:hypothetical protein